MSGSGILWRFRTGSPWAEIPERCGQPTACYNRFLRWRKAWANIPPKASRKGTFAFSRWVFRQRNLVERFLNRIKQFRGIATRHDKRSESYLAAVKLVAARIWCQSL